jgi:molybdopterin adenylyltransferase
VVPLKVNAAVLLVTDTHVPADEATVKLVLDRLAAAGHVAVECEVVKDSLQLVRAQFLKWIADPQVDIVITIAGIDTTSALPALQPSITTPIEGFSELVRVISFEEIGTGAMLVDVAAAQCGSTFVFVLPASMGAVRSALDKLLMPQLDSRTTPRNLTMRMPRLKAAAQGAAPVDVPAATLPRAPTLPRIVAPAGGDAVPRAIRKENTQLGVAPPAQRAARPTPPPPPPAQPNRRRPSTAPPVIVIPAKKPATLTDKPRLDSPAEASLKALWKAEPPASPKPGDSVPAAAQGEPPGEPIEPIEPVETIETVEPVEPEAPPPLPPARKPKPAAELPSFNPPLVELPPRYSEPPRRRRKRGNLWLFAAVFALLSTGGIAGVMMLTGERGSRPSAALPQPAPVIVPQPDAALVAVAPIDAASELAGGSDAPDEEPPDDPPAEEPPTEAPAEPPPPARTRPPTRARRPDPPRRAPDPPVTPPDDTVAKPAVPPRPSGDCDEVSCVLEKYARPCCARYKPADPGPRPVPTMPASLDKALIRAAVDRVRPAIIRCGEVAGVKGTVKITVEVNAPGKVESAVVAASPDPALGRCVADQIKKATFARTQNGGLFTYPFVF